MGWIGSGRARLLGVAVTCGWLALTTAVNLRLPARAGPPPASTNALGKESSPYLLQHAHNPVNWYPWGPVALQKAQREGKPIFLSVGYSTCHWCHVMERESFSQNDVAQALNDHFVAIKVDREERPDVDALYMCAVEVMTGSGGWPHTTLLLPDGRPFFGATYMPKSELLHLLAQANDAYGAHRQALVRDAEQLTDQMRELANDQARGSGKLTRDFLQAAEIHTMETLMDGYDPTRGGFTGPPKFPPHSALALLLSPAGRDPQPRSAMLTTLTAMARGGIHDQLGGGFHRYATDRDWLVPHFEKMLYDNALLIKSYAQAFSLTQNPEYREVAEDIVTWVQRDMTDPAGGFYTALDADAEGAEGSTYVWTRPQILDCLGEPDGLWICDLLGVTAKGNFTGAGLNVLHLTHRNEAASARWLSLRAKLLQARLQRPQPQRDDKVLAGWNGLMIGSLAQASRLLNEPRYLALAQRAAQFAVLTLGQKDGTLRRDWRAGRLGPAAFQDDYAYLADGLLDLAEADGEHRWVEIARQLTDVMVDKFWDKYAGGFYRDSGQDGLLLRLKDPFDNPLPSGNAVAVRVLHRLARLTGDIRYDQRARATANAFQGSLLRAPQGAISLVMAARELGFEPSAKSSIPARATKLRLRATLAPGRSEVNLRLEIAKGWHINANRPLDSSLVATKVTVSGPVRSLPVRYPTPTVARLGGSQVALYRGSLRISLPFRRLAKQHGKLRIRVVYQPCNDRSCLPYETQELTLAF